jgi:hypothetical protein
MKSSRWMLAVVLMAFSAGAFAQSEAQKSFETMKTLAGTWQGVATVVPKMPQMTGDDPRMQLTMRVTSRGNAIVHEMQGLGVPDDPAKYDHPVTMFYLDADRLNLVHYCDAGNRPHMVAKSSSDGKTVEFDFVDITGKLDNGHMQHAVFTLVDANHHTEDWTFLLPGDKPMQAHMELTRVTK